MLPTEYMSSNRNLGKLIGAIFLASMLHHAPVHAQSKERWQRIRTSHYDILFLDEMSRQAQRMANTLEKLYLPTSKTLQISPSRIPIVLRSRTAMSNGFITIAAPRRGVFYNFPFPASSFLMNNDWLNLLAMHELRHVAQFEYYTYPTLSLLLIDYVWLLEGDAVGIETALSTGGRGRSPYFSLLYKVNLLERGGFSYYKQMMRSLKHQIPDHYRLGYFMTTYLRRKYGADIIRQLLVRDGFWERFNTATFYNRLKQLTNKTITEIYQEANEELKGLWKQQLNELKLTPKQLTSKRDTEDYTDYTYPQSTQGGIIVLKSGIGTRPQLVKIDKKGKEHIICAPAAVEPAEKFSTVQDKIIWITYEEASLVAGKASFTTIRSYNLQTKQFKTIGAPKRYQAASLSPDGTKIAVSITDEAYNHSIKILNAETGEVLQQFPNPGNHYYLTPSWSSDGKQVVVVTHAHNKATITCINLQTGDMQNMLPYTTEAIEEPILQGEYIYYGSPYSGIDNIYAIHLKTNQRFQVTSSKYGAYHPAISVDGKWLLYNDFSKDGMDAVQTPLNPQQWTPITQVQDRSVRYYQPLVTQENNADVLTKIPTNVYPIKDYTAWDNLLSARPNFENLHRYYPGTLALGLVLHDLLDRAEWAVLGTSMRPWVGFYADKGHIYANYKGRFFSRFVYKAYKPIITVDASLLARLKKDEQKRLSKEIKKELSLSVKVPFTWISGEYTYHCTFNTTSKLRSITSSTAPWWRTQNYKVIFSRGSSSSPRDIYTPWKQDLLVSYTHTPYGGPITQTFGTQLDLYFPGFFKHHGIQLGMSYQYKPHAPSFAVNPRLLSRDGSASSIDQPLIGSIDYVFPIAYPDWNLLDGVLIQRLRANLFYDCVYDPKLQKPYHAIGMDFTIDFPFIPLTFSFLYSLTKEEWYFGTGFPFYRLGGE